MDQDIAHLDDLRPWDILIGFAESGRKFACRFTDDLDVMNDPGVDEFVFFERATTSLGIPFDLSDGIEDVTEALTVIPHSGMVSLKICLRTRGRSPALLLHRLDV